MNLQNSITKIETSKFLIKRRENNFIPHIKNYERNHQINSMRLPMITIYMLCVTN